MNADIDNLAAQDAYASTHAECTGLLEQIRDTLDNAPAPDDTTTWSHVANLAHLADQLRTIVSPE